MKYALSWYRPQAWAEILGKPEGRVVSNYWSTSYIDTRKAADHINSLDPQLDCTVEKMT